MVYLHVRDEEELLGWWDRCRSMENSIFHEPDAGGDATAMACLDEAGMFKKLKLMRF